MHRLLLILIVITGSSLLLTACAPGLQRDGAPATPVDVSSIPDAVPREEPRSRYGNPESYEVLGKRYYVLDSSRGYVESGIASWYGTKFHGKRTSSGETYDMNAMTAAHKTLPLPTYVEVINLENRKSIIVRVNDRGPFHDNRIIDLSYAAAAKLGIMARGTGLVEVHDIDPSRYTAARGGTPVPSVAIKDVAMPRFYIQVGAFGELMNAENLRAKVAVLGSHLVNISQAVVSGKKLYRVRIGPLESIDNADQIVARLGDIG
ncbi:MAG: septal ring lytic transglycosylase RlpA family protein, partial [Gammaproteobacteria bacterium]